MIGIDEHHEPGRSKQERIPSPPVEDPADLDDARFLTHNIECQEIIDDKDTIAPRLQSLVLWHGTDLGEGPELAEGLIESLHEIRGRSRIVLAHILDYLEEILNGDWQVLDPEGPFPGGLAIPPPAASLLLQSLPPRHASPGLPVHLAFGGLLEERHHFPVAGPFLTSPALILRDIELLI